MNNTINNAFVAAIGGKPGKTATVYRRGEPFAQYSIGIAKEVAREVWGMAVDDETGNIGITGRAGKRRASMRRPIPKLSPAAAGLLQGTARLFVYHASMPSR